MAYVYDLAQKDKILIKLEASSKTFGQIEGETTAGFLVIIKFDVKGNIINAYPKL